MRNRNARNPSPPATKQSNIKKSIAEAMGMSYDIALNLPRVVLIGAGEVTVENYNGILEYSDCVIRVSANGCGVKITGCKLEIRTITAEMLFITGNISGVGFF